MAVQPSQYLPKVVVDWLATFFGKSAPNANYGSGPLSAFLDASNYRAPNAAAALAITNYVGGTNEVVEPSVYYNPNLWNGYEYWMAAGPYDGSNVAFENPSIWASHDGQTWVVPGTNPVKGPPVSGNYADPHLFEYGNVLYLTFSWIGAAVADRVMMTYSTDGIAWAPSVVLLTGASTSTHDLLSPHVEYLNGVWHLWTLNLTNGTTYTIDHRTCSSLTGNWSAATTCTATLPASSGHWEFEIRRVGGQWWMLECVTNIGAATNGRLYLRTSPDGVTWTLPATSVLTANVLNASNFDGSTIYKSGFVPLADGNIAIWYSALSGGNVWKIGYTVATDRQNEAPLASGLWYSPQTATTTTTLLVQADTNWQPVYFPQATLLANVGAEITGAGTAGAVVRLGVYSDVGGRPASLIRDCGTIDGTSATIQTLACASTVGPGIVWFSMTGQGSPGTQPTVRAYTGTLTPIGTTSTLASQNTLGGFHQASHATGVLPSLTVQGSVVARGTMPKIIYQV